MTVEEFLQNYGGNECVSIEGYCEEASYKLRRKTHTLACGMKAAFSVQNYISTT